MSTSLNPWDHKPWWCQPWSILLTGIGMVGGSWLLFQTVWVTVLVTVPILIWWVYFLVIWPKLVRAWLLQTVQDPQDPQSSAGPSTEPINHS